MSRYLFDCELVAAISVEAASEAEAREKLESCIGSEGYGRFSQDDRPGRETLTGECSLDLRHDDPELVEVDGDEVPACSGNPDECPRGTGCDCHYQSGPEGVQT